ncbi:hypothetical protein TW95_gp0367 [Pandoravirus inopinatum]|uniref:Uncharacterized protein n=1 Tax=Pandoravirus inopinatum TaxID=1605721 RepID=A0A0B5J8I5_9VIRU|nr:hypothetical protein TW95_gp0367 [Pandoravirus inopinatum]AJF97101.1 hypothetical protein [Pandoravirus inopinatum]
MAFVGASRLTSCFCPCIVLCAHAKRGRERKGALNGERKKGNSKKWHGDGTDDQARQIVENPEGAGEALATYWHPCLACRGRQQENSNTIGVMTAPRALAQDA